MPLPGRADAGLSRHVGLKPRRRLAASLGLCLVASCTTPAPSVEPQPPDASDPGFLLLGASLIPWARPGATREQFEHDARACLDASTASRRTVSADLEAEKAYDTFQRCMSEQGWSSAAPGAVIERIRPHETRHDGEEWP